MKDIYKKTIISTGFITFGVLMVLSIVFYLYRILNYDSSYQFVKIINKEFFNFEAARYGVFLTQILPLIGIWLGASLKTIMHLFSFSFIFIYFIVFLTVVFYLKKPNLGLLILIVLLFGVKDNFYYIVTETHQALVYSVLFYAWITKNKNFVKSKVLDIAIGLLLILLCFFAHPVSLFTIIFIIGFELLYEKDWKNYNYYIYASFIVLIGLIRFFIGLYFPNINPYETSLFSNIDKAIWVLKHFSNIYTFKFFINRKYSLFLFFLILFLFVVIQYLKEKHFKPLLYIIAFSLAFFVFTVIIYYQGDADCQMEKDFMPLSIFLGVPFVKDMDIKKPINYIKLFIISSGIVFHIYLIIQISSFYKLKLNYLYSLIEYAKKNNKYKYVVTKDNIPKVQFVFWPLSTETLLLSSMEPAYNSTSFFFCDQHNPHKYLSDTTHFYNAPFWEPWKITDINPKYFNLKGKYNLFTLKDFDIIKFNKEILYDMEDKNKIDTNNVCISSQKSYHGTYSMKLLPHSDYTIKLNTKTIKSFVKIGFWKYDINNNNASLVIYTKNYSFYIETNKAIINDSISNWQYIEMDAFVKNCGKDTVFMTIKNNSNENIYVDDIILKY